MTAIIIIGLMLLLIYAVYKKTKSTKQNTTDTISNKSPKSEKEIQEKLVETFINNLKFTIQTSGPLNNNNDDSIIDVTGNYEKIGTPANIIEFDSWKLGNKFKNKLKLSDNEVEILNNLIDTDNKFNSIPYCAEYLIRLLFDSLNYLEEYFGIEEHNKIKAEIFDVEIKKQYKYRKGSYNYNNAITELRNKYNQCIYKTCENELRGFLNVGRRTELNWYLRTNEALNLFEEKVLSIVYPYIEEDLFKNYPIDLESEILINNYNRSRYKEILEKIKVDFNEQNINVFKQQIAELEKRNFENPFIENIYYEASKFISNVNNILALEYYVRYVYYDLKSATFDNKQFTKTIQKSLFKTNEQLHDFEIIVSELIKDKNLDKALKSVSKIYEIKRKKIHLDITSIKEVQQQHSTTVELLNEYLKDDSEDENNSIKSQEISNEEIKIEITQKHDDISHSAFVYELPFTPIHISALELFSKSNFSVMQSELEQFAKSKGVFKNQLIESINETCYEFLDDVLIEEEEDYYTINPNYFQRISAK
ncbi:MAG: hypothetical protein IPN31_09975 [Bacteroidetes bacterium]|nr:hypothetical protein [Bacteroidota bacterium]